MAAIKSYTDLKQSKKLAEILPLKTADYCWGIDDETLQYNNSPYPCAWKDYTCKEYYIPCWSLATLMHLLPSKFTKKGNCSETTYNIDIRKYALTEDTNIYQIAYGNYKFYEDGKSSWKDIINTSEKENLIDVAFEMICWLKENNVL
jgi:hypothetical protein